MARGGPRPGSGRKPGSTNKNTRAVAVAAAAAGITPAEVMLEIMRVAHKAGNIAVALDAAAKVAPFIHPRLSAVALDLRDISNDELRKLAE